MRPSECKARSARGGPIDRAARPLGTVVLTSILLLPPLAGCSGPILTFRPQPAAGAAEPESTGSIVKPPTSFGRELNAEDWRRAHAAMGVALDPQGNGRPVKWDNPDTAMRGAVSPTGLPYVSNDEVCRDFLATVISPQRSRFVRGTGCKPAGGDWWLRRLRTARA